MLRRAHRDQRGITSSDYAGILVVVSLVFLALFALNLDEKVAPAVERAVCQILGGESCAQEVAGEPEKCLIGQTTTSANANVLVAFVQIDKDSILIREDYSDGSSKFTIVDNTQAAGELFAGAKAKVGKLGADLSAEALAGTAGPVPDFDELFDGIKRPRPFLKLDTQGFDLDVFKGAGDAIDRFVGLQSELSLMEIYKGMPGMQESLAAYEEAGFEIAALYPVSRQTRTARVLEYDCVMVRASAVRAEG